MQRPGGVEGAVCTSISGVPSEATSRSVPFHRRPRSCHPAFSRVAHASLLQAASWNNSKEQLSQNYRKVKDSFLFLETLEARWALSSSSKAASTRGKFLSFPSSAPFTVQAREGAQVGAPAKRSSPRRQGRAVPTAILQSAENRVC